MKRFFVIAFLSGIIQLSAQSSFFSDSSFFEPDTTLRSGLDLRNNDDFEGFSLFDTVLSDYNVFIHGENHSYTKSNAALSLKTIKYLNEKAGVNHLLLELGWSRGYLITKYLETGDSTLLKSIKTFSWEAYGDMIEDLYQYNLSLPENRKIVVTGIDVERFHSMALKTLSLLFSDSNGELHDSIKIHVESVNAAVSYLERYNAWDAENNTYENYFDYYNSQYYSVDNTVRLFLENVRDHRSKYENYISRSDFYVFEKVIKQLEDGVKYHSYDYEYTFQGYIYRENYMYDQFMELYQSDTSQKFFMQFGRCHSVKTEQYEACSWIDYKSIAHRLNASSDTSLAGKVMSTAIFYPRDESWYYLDDTTKIHADKYYLTQSYKDSITLWDVRNDSVFQGKHEFMIVNYKSLNTEADDRDLSSSSSGTRVETGVQVFGDVKFGWTNMDIPKTSEYLFSNGFDYYDPSLYMGLGFGVNFKSGFYTYLDLDMIEDFSFTEDDAYLFLENRSWGLHLGWDFLPNKKIDIVPFVGVGHQKIVVDYKVPTGETTNSLFPTTIYDEGKVKGRSFNWRTGARLGWTSGYFTGGFECSWLGGEELRWTNKGDRVDFGGDDVPTSLFIGLYLGMNFKTYKYD